MPEYYLKRNDAIQLDMVTHLQALENYTMFHLLDGKCLISSLTMKRHQDRLTQEFIRINRSTMINIRYVKGINCKNHTNFIKMLNGKEFKVSRRRSNILSQLAS